VAQNCCVSDKLFKIYPLDSVKPSSKPKADNDEDSDDVVDEFGEQEEPKKQTAGVMESYKPIPLSTLPSSSLNSASRGESVTPLLGTNLGKEEESKFVRPGIQNFKPEQEEAYEREKQLLSQLEGDGSLLAIFYEYTFCLLAGSDVEPKRRNIINKLILFSGGFVYDEFCPSITHILVLPISGLQPQHQPRSISTNNNNTLEDQIEALRRVSPGLKILHITWLYECIKNKTRSIPAIPWNRPQNDSQLVKLDPRSLSLGLKGKFICVSGYVGDERDEVRRLTELHGGKYTERLTKMDPVIDVLICKEKSGTKFDMAIEWGIKTHDIEWLRTYSSR
jgi:hypothetical protein